MCYLIRRCASLRVEMAEGFVDMCWDEAEEEVGPEEDRNSETNSDEENKYLQMYNVACEIELIHRLLQFCLCKSTCQWVHKCPCKGKGRFCTARCRCKVKSGPCKNRLEGEGVGLSRVQEALQASQEAVKV